MADRNVLSEGNREKLDPTSRKGAGNETKISQSKREGLLT